MLPEGFVVGGENNRILDKVTVEFALAYVLLFGSEKLIE
jgi:hypothetical protein